MTSEERNRILDRLLENQAHHDVILQKLEENHAHHEVILRRLEGSQEHHEMILRKLEELQMMDHVAIGRLNGVIAAFAEQHHTALLEIDNRLIRLESLIEAFVRGSRHNGGSQES